MSHPKQFEILEFVKNNPTLSSKEIHDSIALSMGYATVKRILKNLVSGADGNKRAARILSNAALLNQGHCPISFRTVDTLDFKKAMLLFYEQNNLTAIKKIFIDQYEFAVNTYF